MMIIINCMCTIALTSSSTNNESNRIDPIVRSLKHIVDKALQDDTSDDIDNDSLIEQLSQIIEQEEGFRVADHKQRSLHSTGDNDPDIFDGSGDLMGGTVTPFYSNMSIVTFTMGPAATAFAKYTPRAPSQCRCEKGERGLKGDPGICPADCGVNEVAPSSQCLGSRINLEYLAESIRQLISDSKKLAYRNALAVPCACIPPTAPSTLPSTTSTTSTSSTTPFTLDYNTLMQLKGEKGDRGETGTSCSPACTQSAQSNVRVFRTLQQAIGASSTYPDHTYIHIVNEPGQLQGVYIRVLGQLIPIRLENERTQSVQQTVGPTTTVTSPSPKCSTTLPCPRLHLFALGPYVRKLCTSRPANVPCSKLSDYDELCGYRSKRQRLTGTYRAFMSASTRWLSNLFTGTCVNAKIVNMKESVLFDSYEDIFQQKPAQSEVLDVEGAKPQFRFWWHGTHQNGTASKDTCIDWSRHDSYLSCTASRLPNGTHGIFHQPTQWPCSIADENVGIFCIETDCRRANYKKP